MDMITLAMAKAYADSKVAKEISLDEYNIPIVGMVMNNMSKATVDGTGKLWEEINKYKDVAFLINMGDVTIRAIPTSYSTLYGEIVSVGVRFQALYMNTMILEATIVMDAKLENSTFVGTNVYCVKTVTSLI